MMAANSSLKIHINAHDSAIEEHSDVACSLCEEGEVKYTCPRCNIMYCSLNCYQSKKHRICSELFYRDNVLQELKLGAGGESVKGKLVQRALKLLKDENELDKGSVSDFPESDYQIDPLSLAERLSDIDLDNTAGTCIWKKLTENEKDCFFNSVEKGNVTLVELWKPWWKVAVSDASDGAHPIIRELQSDEETYPVQATTGIPKILDNLPALSSLLRSKDPSPALAFNVTEVLFIYTFIERLYDGEPEECLREVITRILDLSHVLSQDQTYFNLSSCLHSVIQRIQDNKLYSEAADLIHISLKDLTILLKGKSRAENTDGCIPFALAAISHLYQLFADMKRRILRKRSSDTTAVNTLSKKLTKVNRKLYFFAIWIKENPNLIIYLSEDVSLELTKITKHSRELKEDQEMIEHNLRCKKFPLIEELNH